MVGIATEDDVGTSIDASEIERAFERARDISNVMDAPIPVQDCISAEHGFVSREVVDPQTWLEAASLASGYLAIRLQGDGGETHFLRVTRSEASHELTVHQTTVTYESVDPDDEPCTIDAAVELITEFEPRLIPLWKTPLREYDAGEWLGNRAFDP